MSGNRGSLQDWPWRDFLKELGLRFSALISVGFGVLILLAIGSWLFPFRSPFVDCRFGCDLNFSQVLEGVWWLFWTPMLISCALMALVQAWAFFRFREGKKSRTPEGP